MRSGPPARGHSVRVICHRYRSDGSCRCRDRPRTATPSWESNASPPRAGPGFDRPASVTLANKVTAPLIPSIFQIDPGPPIGSAAPHSPGMKVTPVPPRRDMLRLPCPRSHDRQAICRACGDINVRGDRIVERNGKHLTDLRRRRSVGLGCVHELRVRRALHVLQIDDAQRRAVDIDQSPLSRINASGNQRWRRRVRESGDGSVPGRENARHGALCEGPSRRRDEAQHRCDGN